MKLFVTCPTLLTCNILLFLSFKYQIKKSKHHFTGWKDIPKLLIVILSSEVDIILWGYLIWTIQFFPCQWTLVSKEKAAGAGAHLQSGPYTARGACFNTKELKCLNHQKPKTGRKQRMRAEFPLPTVKIKGQWQNVPRLSWPHQGFSLYFMKQKPCKI